jgi:hypothetical protein
MTDTPELILNLSHNLNGIPVYKAIDVSVKGNKLRGQPAGSHEPNSLIEMRAGTSGKYALMDATCDVEGNTGHLDVYANLLPEDMTLNLLPCTSAVVESSDFIESSINPSQVVILAGGEHLGEELTGRSLESKSAARYGEINQLRDLQNKRMMETCLYDQNKFLIGVCRGFQVLVNCLTGLSPFELLPYHEPGKSETGFVKHPVSNALANYFPNELYPGFSYINNVNSFHAQGFEMGRLAPMLDQLSYLGWYPLLIDATPGVPLEKRALEGLIRINNCAEVTGIAFQSHPERQNDLNGMQLRTLTQQYISRFLAS